MEVSRKISNVLESFSTVGSLLFRPPPLPKQFQENLYLSANFPNSVVQFFERPFPSAWVLAKPWTLEELSAIVIFFNGTSSRVEDSICFGYDLSVSLHCAFISVSYPGYYMDTSQSPQIELTERWMKEWFDAFLHQISIYLGGGGGWEKEEIKAKVRKKIMIFGHSLGASIALSISTNPLYCDFIRAVVLVSVFDTLKRGLRRAAPSKSVLSLGLALYPDRMNNAKQYAPKLKLPVMIISFSEDRLTSPHATRTLLENSPSISRAFLHVSGRSHGFSLFLEGSYLLPNIKRFWDDLLTDQKLEQKQQQQQPIRHLFHTFPPRGQGIDPDASIAERVGISTVELQKRWKILHLRRPNSCAKDLGGAGGREGGVDSDVKESGALRISNRKETSWINFIKHFQRYSLEPSSFCQREKDGGRDQVENIVYYSTLPVLLLLATSLIVGACLFFSLLKRIPRKPHLCCS